MPAPPPPISLETLSASGNVSPLSPTSAAIVAGSSSRSIRIPPSVIKFCNQVDRFVESKYFQQFVFLVIIFASILIGVETDSSLSNLPITNGMETFITYFFALELFLRMVGGVYPHKYFFEGGVLTKPNWWHFFDATVVILCFLNISAVAVVRLFRLLRVLKLVRAVPTLRMLLSGLMASMGSIGYILVLLVLLFYVFAILGMILFQDKDQDHFGDLPITVVTLFAISTGGSWTAVQYQNVFECDDGSKYPHCTNIKPIGWLGVAYFAVFILLSSMVLLNLVIGVITQSMDAARKENMAEAENAVLAKAARKRSPPTGLKKVVIDALIKLRLMGPPTVENREVIAFKKGQQGILRALDAHIELATRLRITVVNLQKRREMMKKRQRMGQDMAYCPYRDGIVKLNSTSPGMKYPYDVFTNICAHIALSKIFQLFTLLVVILAAVLIGWQTSLDGDSTTRALEEFVKWTFVFELVVKTLACGLRPHMYFFTTVLPVVEIDYWNVLDAVVVVASFLDVKQVAVLRLLRLIRILKLIRAIPTLRNLLVGLVKSLGSMFYVFMLLMLLFYIFGILGILIFRDNDPVHFDSLGLAFLTLMQCATGDDWSEILWANYKGCKAWVAEGYPPEKCDADSPQPLLTILFFVIFMLLSAMVTLNLVIGVINSSMEETQEELKSEKELEMMQLLDAGAGDAAQVSNANHTQVAMIMTSLLKLQDIQLQSLLDKHLLSKKVSDNPVTLSLAQPINMVDPLMFRPAKDRKKQNDDPPRKRAESKPEAQIPIPISTTTHITPLPPPPPPPPPPRPASPVLATSNEPIRKIPMVTPAPDSDIHNGILSETRDESLLEMTNLSIAPDQSFHVKINLPESPSPPPAPEEPDTGLFGALPSWLKPINSLFSSHETSKQ